MRIAIDLTSIPSQLTGVGYYAKNLVSSLFEIDKANSYYVFIKRGRRVLPNINQANVFFIVVLNYPPVIRLLWENFVLPLYLLFLKIDLLHSPHYSTPLFGSWFKRVITFHDMTFFLFPQKHQRVKSVYFQWAMKKSILLANAIISVSDSTTKDVLSVFKTNNTKIFTIHEAAANDFKHNINLRLDILKNMALELPDNYILFVGTIEPRKNILGLIRAYLLFEPILKEKYKLVIVGKKGWYYEEVFSIVREKGINDRVLFAGYVPEEYLPLIYNRASLFVYPSFYEGFGLPVLEALTCGVPVITSNISSMPEIAGNAAILVNPNDIGAINRAMAKILNSPEISKRMKNDAVIQASKFSWEKSAQATLGVYEHVMSEN